MKPDVFSVDAYSFNARFVLKEVASWFPSDVRVTVTKTHLVARWTDTEIAFVFDFGAIAFFNATHAHRDSVLKTFVEKLPREPHPPLREDVLVEVRPGAAIVADFERVVVPELTPMTMEVISLVVCQSVALDYYDEDVQEILDRIGGIADEIAAEGKPPGRRKDLTRFVGSAIASQVEIISSLALLDKPDLTWENETADRLHERFRNNLEIPERYKAIESKLTTVRESLAAFLELSATNRAFWLEAAVVALILFEIVVSFVRAR